MPTPYHCNECDTPTMSPSGICDPCMEEIWEKTTADEYNEKWREPIKFKENI